MFQWIFRFSDFTCFLDSWLPTNLKPWRGTQTWALRALPVFSSCTPTKKVNPQAPRDFALVPPLIFVPLILGEKMFRSRRVEMDWHGLAHHRGAGGWKKQKAHRDPGPSHCFFLQKYQGKMIWTKTHVILDSRCSFCFCMFHPFSTFATKKPSKYLLHSAGKAPCLWFLAVPELEEHVLPPIRVCCSWCYCHLFGVKSCDVATVCPGQIC